MADSQHNGIVAHSLDDVCVVTNGTPDKVPEGYVNIDQTDSSAYMANYKAHKTGISHREMVDAYSEWADNYDKDLCPGRYNGPAIAAEALAKYYTDPEARANFRVLDVAAGTGRVGYELYKIGFRKIDALEPSSGMLRVLRGREVYDKTFESPIGFKVVDEIPENSYDTLVIAGGMGEGHIPVSAITEMIRVVKPGGIVLIVMREEYLSYVKEYVGKLEPYMDSLEKDGFWKLVTRDIVPQYSFNKNGVVYTYQVTSESYPKEETTTQ